MPGGLKERPASNLLQLPTNEFLEGAIRGQPRFVPCVARLDFNRKRIKPPAGSKPRVGRQNAGGSMLSWTITLLVIALIAALLGFTGIAGAAAGIAKILFAVFLILFVISLF